MLNIKYAYMYDSQYGLFESTKEKVRNTNHYKMLHQFIWSTTKGIVFYCNNKPIKIIWNK